MLRTLALAAAAAAFAGSASTAAIVFEDETIGTTGTQAILVFTTSKAESHQSGLAFTGAPTAPGLPNWTKDLPWGDILDSLQDLSADTDVSETDRHYRPAQEGLPLQSN